MYRTKEHIDIQQELNAMIELIDQTWEKPANCDVAQVLQAIWGQSLSACSSCTRINQAYDLVSEMSMSRSDYEVWEKAGTKLTKNDVLNGYRNDAITQVYKEMMFNINFVANKMNDQFDFSKAYKKIASTILKQYPEIKKIKPKGYKTNKSPEQCYDNEDIDYNGVNSASATNGGFDVTTSLRSCMYDKDGSTNYKFVDTLIEATLRHAYYVAGHNNGVELKNELTVMKEHFNQPEYFKEIVAKVDVEPFCQSVLLKKLYDQNLSKIEILTPEELTTLLKEKKEAKEKFDALPEEERNKIKAENAIIISNALKDIFKKPKM